MLDVIAPLVVENTTKIVLMSLDGLAGLPHPDTGRSEMETAAMPPVCVTTSPPSFLGWLAVGVGSSSAAGPSKYSR